MQRGARRAPIFRADDHCGLFLGIVEEVIDKFELEVHGYALMPNHYHLLVRSRHGNLSDGMRHLNGVYTRMVNRVHGWDGPVFRGRFRSQQVSNETRLPYILTYIHLNPLRANLVTRIDGECWTSHRAYLGRRYAPSWVTTGYFLGVFGGPREMQEHMLAVHRGKMIWPEELDLASGFLGRQEEVARRETSGAPGGEKLGVRQVLERVRAVTGATARELGEARRGPRANPGRRFAVWALREHTLLTSRQVGAQLGVSADQVSNVIRRFDVGAEPFRTWIRGWDLYDK